MVKYLIELGADINKEENFDNLSPLIWACSSGNIKLVKYLIGLGANTTVKLMFWVVQVKMKI
jgi:ankyrin repeat protein